jgi:hypothetical protein
LKTPLCKLAGGDCPICGPIFEAIAAAPDFSALHEIRRVTIPHAKGISREERDEMFAAVIVREAELVGGQMGGRP